MAEPIETPFGTFIETSPGNFEFYNPPAVAQPATPTPVASGLSPADRPKLGSSSAKQKKEKGPQDCPPGYIWDAEKNQCVLDPATTQASRIYIPGAYERFEEKDPMRDPSRKPSGAPLGFDYVWNGVEWELKETAQAGPTQAQRESARDVITALLEDYGLTGVSDFVYRMVFEEDVMSGEEILARMRADQGSAGETYRKRFAGNIARRNAGLNALTESQYIAMESEMSRIMRAAGLPSGFYDSPDDYSALIGGDVSPSELQTRINEGYLAVQQANPQVVAELKRLYPVGDGELAAYFLDPEKATPLLLRQARAAQIAAEATMQAEMAITAGTAEELAVAGISPERARAGFQAIGAAEELFVALPGTTEQAITEEEQIGGVFGTSAAAQQRIRQRTRERQATFEAGGRFAGQGTTVTGLQ